MRLKKILKNIDVVDIKNFKNYNINAITHISKDVCKDSMFICISGNNFDGNDFVDSAIRNGAKCIVTEKEIYCDNATIVRVQNIRKCMSVIAKNFYNNSCDKLKIIGIVGTSGKTSCTMIVANILKVIDNNIGIIGTNGVYIGNTRLENNFTTPDPLELHYIFYQMKMLNVKYVIMEVSAQAIYYYKMWGIRLDIGVFTNISREHLDFFGSMENYAQCKINYFDDINMKECVVNVDDFYGKEIAYKSNIPCVTYGITQPSNSFALDVNLTINNTKFTANILDYIINVDTKLIGIYNVYNLLASMTVCKMLGVSSIDIERQVNSIKAIEGRFNIFKRKDKNVIVDFAHTPDSFEKTLSFVKECTKEKIITVFGCVGYSDYLKRKDMGLIASIYSDYIILTLDNLCNANFDDVCKDIISGINNCKFEIIEDREKAIIRALQIAKHNDIVCVLGKGAEEYQKIGDKKIKYSDLDVVKKLLEE